MVVPRDQDVGGIKNIDGGPNRSGFRLVKILMVVPIDQDLGWLNYLWWSR